MNKNTLFCIICSALLLGACENKERNVSDDVKIFDLSQFQNIDLSEGKVVTDDPDIMSMPRNITLVNDSIIAICQARSNSQVVLYNMKTGEWQTAIKRGEGPLEMLNVTSMSVDSANTLWVSGLHDKKIMTTRWNSEGNEAITELKYHSPEDLLRSVTDNKEGMIGMPISTRNIRAIRLNHMGEATDTLGAFPSATLSDSVFPTNFMYQADIAYSADNEKLVIANKSWNEIGIYPVTDRGEIILKYPLEEELVIKESVRGIGRAYNPYPMWFVFSGVRAYDNGFAVGFIGVKPKSRDDFNAGIKKILELDWAGNPKRSFSFDESITTFEIDVKNNIIYTIEDRPDPTLVKYEF